MPTYGYHCPRCKTEFEVFRRMTDDPAADCPECGTPGRRLFFPAGIVFKGSGFYKTDSRRAGTASVNGGGPSSAAKAAGDGSGGTGGQKPTAGDRSATGDRAASPEKATGAAAPRGDTAAAGGPTST